MRYNFKISTGEKIKQEKGKYNLKGFKKGGKKIRQFSSKQKLGG
jgi:hypothetical protein